MRLIDADKLIELEKKEIINVKVNLKNAQTENAKAYWRGVLIERELMIECIDKIAQIENPYK